MISSGCGTNRVVVIPPSEPLERAKPIEAMQKCQDALSQLPDEFPTMDIQSALELLEVNHVVDSTFFFGCKRQQEELVKWIKDE